MKWYDFSTSLYKVYFESRKSIIARFYFLCTSIYDIYMLIDTYIRCYIKKRKFSLQKEKSSGYIHNTQVLKRGRTARLSGGKTLGGGWARRFRLVRPITRSRQKKIKFLRFWAYNRVLDVKSISIKYKHQEKHKRNGRNRWNKAVAALQLSLRNPKTYWGRRWLNLQLCH